jgi:hypothetical protein
MMMRAKQRRLLLTSLILGFLILRGSIQYRGFIPFSSGGSGINSDISSPFILADPVFFNTVQDNLKSDGEPEKRQQ